MPLSELSVTRDPLPHLPPHPKAPAASSSHPKAPTTSPPRPKARAPSSSAMSKLDYPKLNEELSLTVIHGWLGRCEDTFESWQAMNPDKLIAACTLIMLAGLKMEESTAATWWNENCDKLKKLESWAEFAQEQGSSSFLEFAKALQNVRNALAGAGQSWVISNAVLKNHLLFLSHPVLCLRVSGQQSLPFTTMKVDTLIATMSLTWDSMLAEGAIRVLRAPLVPSQLVIPFVPAALSSSLPTPPSSALPSGFVPLTHAEKEALHAAGGCYHCRKTLQGPGWVKHRSDSCPGDAACGIPSRASPAVVAAVGPVGFSSTYEEGYKAVAAVMPAYNPEEAEWSYGTDDSDLSTRDY
ncbi:hypothetical protein B0H14DRAFT_3773892 [Mycena olivaceomarginata]|nr:hypothetical protein B0H14DRAFT_3773892 [Mycena olivaceomarginata]